MPSARDAGRRTSRKISPAARFALRFPRSVGYNDRVLKAPGTILAVGGAEDKFDKRIILQRFVEEAGGATARIAILPTASTIPDKRAEFYREVFSSLGAAAAYPVPIARR